MAKELWVGPNETYKSIAGAVKASAPGDSVYVRAGTYTNDFTDVPHDLKIIGAGGKAHLKATKSPENGKAYLVTNGNITLENLEISGVKVSAKNGAAVRHEGGDLTIKNSHFHHNEMGLLTKAVMPDVKVTIEGSKFSHMGNGVDVNHGLYFGHIRKVEISNSEFHDTAVGHHVKSRAGETIVKNSNFYDGADGRSSYAIDIPNGGKALISGNEFQKGTKSENVNFISFGAEGANGSKSLTVENNSFTTKNAWTTAVSNMTDTPVKLVNNSYDGVKNVAWGPYTESNAKPAEAEPPQPEPVPAPVETAPEPAPQPEPEPVPESLPAPAAPAPMTPPSGANVIEGNEAGNLLLGTADSDWLFGHDGVDVLNGRAGDDVLVGGAGRDFLSGGPGADLFLYRSVDDSRAADGVLDLVLDFSTIEGDRIALSEIDADETSAGHQSFTFIGAQSFSGKAGELNFRVTDLGVSVEGDVNGDGTADLRIDLLGVQEVTAENFVL